ncbi:MAG: (Fe-S)-binding protein [Lachnospiraceae bacterium]|nr:(Fe-S)-binding protein [Lachnospiraceae bacterium]
MSRLAKVGMALHQSISFCPVMMRIPKAEALFWPGCALLTLDAGICEKTLAFLKRKEPGIKLAAACCGHPSEYLFPHKFAKRIDRQSILLKHRGVERIYTACPNCTVQLQTLEGIRIIPVWQIIAEGMETEESDGLKRTDGKGALMWHDPCPTRSDERQQQDVRIILKGCGYDVREPEHTGSHTMCCGNHGMLHITDPKRSVCIRQKRLEEFPPETVIVSSCEGCLGAFRKEGRRTLHLLELLFGRSRKRGWGNRIKTTIFHVKK